jgi:hypothetical protein
MDMFDAINQQQSVKAFEPTHRFTAAEEMKLLEAAIQSPTSFNMQSWPICRTGGLRSFATRSCGNRSGPPPSIRRR